MRVKRPLRVTIYEAQEGASELKALTEKVTLMRIDPLFDLEAPVSAIVERAISGLQGSKRTTAD